MMFIVIIWSRLFTKYNLGNIPILTNGAALKSSMKISPRWLPSIVVRPRTAKPCGQTGYKSRASVRAQYNSRESGVGDFLGGFFVGGLVFGALGYLLAPQISKNLWVEEGVKKKVLKLIDDGEEGLEVARKSLSEKIAQLNSAIDGISDKLKTEKGIKLPKRTVREEKSVDHV